MIPWSPDLELEIKGTFVRVSGGRALVHMEGRTPAWRAQPLRWVKCGIRGCRGCTPASCSAALSHGSSSSARHARWRPWAGPSSPAAPIAEIPSPWPSTRRPATSLSACWTPASTQSQPTQTPMASRCVREDHAAQWAATAASSDHRCHRRGSARAAPRHGVAAMPCPCARRCRVACMTARCSPTGTARWVDGLPCNGGQGPTLANLGMLWQGRPRLHPSAASADPLAPSSAAQQCRRL